VTRGRFITLSPFLHGLHVCMGLERMCVEFIV
jgi:hypothetical protein